ncbi:MAG TPA: GntR family transcriptional regulator [Candidatus Acidoferrales bacterium]|jgi:DNA-binding GntR family transcriptional regulator|nr:GntR family transcriptional regulator [Candidatus Acidoferrales bacterium]
MPAASPISITRPGAVESTGQTVTLGPVRQRALRESVFEVLLLAIVRGQMKPGIWSNHKLLAEQLNVSVTPLREALQELAACGIIENHYNRGTIVRPFGPPQLFEIFQVRAILEGEAARLACDRIDNATLTELKSQATELISKESSDWTSLVVASDDNFHSSIASFCGNQRLKEEIFRYRSLLTSIRRAVADHHYPFDLALPEHLAVIEALLNHQPAEAAGAMNRHILSSAKICSDLLFPEIKEKN